MESVASQLIQEVTAHAQNDSLEDAREICADGTYFQNDLRICNASWYSLNLASFNLIIRVHWSLNAVPTATVPCISTFRRLTVFVRFAGIAEGTAINRKSRKMWKSDY